jgi:intein/homing endonuclease
MPYDILIGRDKADKERFGNKGLIYTGKGYVTMGNYTSLSNLIWLDVARSHIIMVAGKHGCLTEETLVFTDKGYKQIKDFDKTKDKIFSFNKDKEKFEWETADLLEYPIKNEELYELKFNDGRKIRLTREHPLLASYGKYIYWKRACDLKVNDKIISPTEIPEIKKDKESLRIARLLGFIMSDGTINIRKGKFIDGRGKSYNGTKARIRIYNQCEEVLKQAKEDIEKEFKVTAKRYQRNDCNCEVIETKHQKIVNKFIDLGIPKGHKSGIIRIPEVVMNGSNKFKAEFISALFSCDGYIPKTGRYLDYSSKSREFVEDLQLILSHFNIQSSIRIKNAKFNGKIYPNYRLFITDNQSVENFKKIGIISKFKQERLNNFKREKLGRRKKTHYHTDKLACIKIEKISKIKNIKRVYDLSVDRNHSFIANGIISHNSGKSYTLGTIAEELCDLPKEVSKNIAPIIFDTMGIFWTMKFKNDKETELLQEWGLKPKNLPVQIWAPYGHFKEYEKRQIPVDKKFALEASELSAEDWILTFNLEMMDPASILIQEAVSKLKGNYSVDDIIKTIEKQPSNPETKAGAKALFNAAKTWGIFAEQGMIGTKISDLIDPGKSTILDISVYSSIGKFNVRALVIGMISKKLFNQRMLARKKEEMLAVQKGADYLNISEKRESPLVWIFIDEAH